jgi:hypothetical protein
MNCRTRKSLGRAPEQRAVMAPEPDRPLRVEVHFLLPAVIWLMMMLS